MNNKKEIGLKKKVSIILAFVAAAAVVGAIMYMHAVIISGMIFSGGAKI